jgi:hypothetical protein
VEDPEVGMAPHAVMFIDIYTSVSAHEFIASYNLQPGMAPRMFANPVPIYFDPAPHGPDSCLSHLGKGGGGKGLPPYLWPLAIKKIGIFTKIYP